MSAAVAATLRSALPIDEVRRRDALERLRVVAWMLIKSDELLRARYGSGLSRTAGITLKVALLAPMPSASDTMVPLASGP